MSARPFVLGVIGVASIGAAAAGGFLALRMNRADQAIAQVGAPNAMTPVETVPAEPPPPPPPAIDPPAGTTRPDSRVARRAGDRAPRAQTQPGPSPQVADPSPASASTSVPPATAVGTVTPPAADSAPPTPPANAQAGDIASPGQEPQKPQLQQVVVKEDSVIGIRLDSTVSSETARVEDRVTGHVTRDVTVDGRTAIPSGAQIMGVVTVVARGGKIKERARIGMRFNTLVLADGTRTAIQTDSIFRDGESPTGQATSKIGASAVIGAILGAVIGGKKGAAIGTTAGAAGGTAAVMAGSRSEAVVPAGTSLTVRLTAPVTVVVEKRPEILNR